MRPYPRPAPLSPLRFLRGLAVFVVVLSAQSCMEPLYFEGPPPADASFSIFVRARDTLSERSLEGRYQIRTHLTLQWSMSPADFSAHPQLVDLQDIQKTHFRRFHLHRPSDSIVDTFTCEPGQITGQILSDLGSGYLLEISKQTVSTEWPTP